MARHSARALLASAGVHEIEITISEDSGGRGVAEEAANTERLSLEKHLLIDNAEIILEYKSLALSDSTQEADLLSADHASKGVIGHAIEVGKTEVAIEKLRSWVAYFSRSIETVLLVSDAVKRGASLSDEAIALTLSMANEMLLALDRTIEARVAESDAA